MKTALKFTALLLTSYAFSTEHNQANLQYSSLLLWQIAQRMVELEQAGVKAKPLTYLDHLKELKIAHDKIMHKRSRRALGKYQRNRALYGYKDTHLNHRKTYRK